MYRPTLAINFGININSPVSHSQIAAGTNISQEQELNINSLDELVAYLEKNFDAGKIKELKDELAKLDDQMKSDAVKPSMIRRIKELVTNLRPSALIVMEVIQKLINLSE